MDKPPITPQTNESDTSDPIISPVSEDDTRLASDGPKQLEGDPNAPRGPRPLTPPMGTTDTFDTPLRVKRSHTPHSQMVHTELAREDVVQDLGPIAEVLFDDFMNKVFPPATRSLVGGVLERFKANGLPDSRWKEFPKDPSASAVHEVPTFEPLTSIFNQCILYAQEIVNADSSMEQVTVSVKMVQKPQEANISERPNNAQPDGFMVLLSMLITSVTAASTKNVKFNWGDIVASMEWKKGNSVDDCRDVRIILFQTYSI